MFTYPVGTLNPKTGDPDFKLTINTALGTGDTMQLPLPSGETYNFIVDWGDSSQDTITVYNQAETLHAYLSGGIYQITITGKCGGWFFNNGGDKLKVTSINNWGFVDFDELNFAFYGCSNLSSLPVTGSIDGTSNVLNITSLFRSCTSLTDTTNDIFKNLTSLVSALNIFYGCSNLVTLGPELLKYNINLINTANAFYLCTSLLTIPADFLRYNTALTNITQMLGSCYALTTIPVDFLRYNILLTIVNGLFTVCYLNLRSLPEDLFYYNSLITNYSSVFFRCRNIVLPTRIFNTTNLNIVTVFNNFMAPDSASYSNTGTIQDIWTYATSATSTNAFLNQTALTNYASIPNGWKGL